MILPFLIMIALIPGYAEAMKRTTYSMDTISTDSFNSSPACRFVRRSYLKSEKRKQRRTAPQILVQGKKYEISDLIASTIGAGAIDSNSFFANTQVMYRYTNKQGEKVLEEKGTLSVLNPRDIQYIQQGLWLFISDVKRGKKFINVVVVGSNNKAAIEPLIRQAYEMGHPYKK